MNLELNGRVWLFDDDINTDLIIPNRAFTLPVEEQVKYVFSANRPGWVDLVKPGDVIVAGHNFGMGSSRPAARSLKNLGIGCLLAESINGLFYRNAINWGFPALECPGVRALFSEGDIASISFANSSVTNLANDKTLNARPTPAALVEILAAGGVWTLLEAEGYIAPKPATS